jgi:hypothetical protein
MSGREQPLSLVYLVVSQQQQCLPLSSHTVSRDLQSVIWCGGKITTLGDCSTSKPNPTVPPICFFPFFPFICYAHSIAFSQS